MDEANSEFKRQLEISKNNILALKSTPKGTDERWQLIFSSLDDLKQLAQAYKELIQAERLPTSAPSQPDDHEL